MANRSRSDRPTSGVVQEPGTTTRPTGSPPVVKISEEEAQRENAKPVSLSHEDFEDNPAVVNMADVPGVEDAGGIDVNRIRNDANDANTRRIIDQDRSKPASSPFSNADLGVPEEGESEDDPLAGAPINRPSLAVEQTPQGEAEEPKKGAKSKKTGSVLVTLGDSTKYGGRAPYAVTVIVPPAGADDEEAHKGLITQGTTIQLARGRATRVSARAAAWLESHPVYDIREVEVQK